MTAVGAGPGSGTAGDRRNPELERLLRRDLDGEVAFDDYTGHLFSRDASMYAIRPVGVAFPRHGDDVAAAVAAAASLGVPIVPRGAGTSLAGQTVGAGLVLDMSRHMDRIHRIDPDARTALVKALSMPDPAAALGDERLHEILDLCLMCKACKSECPLGVDMATLKRETLSHHHDLHGVPLRSRLFGAIRTLNRVGAATAPLSNLPVRLRPVRALMGRTLGIAPQRPLPVFERRTLSRWLARRARPPTPGAGTVTFLADSHHGTARQAMHPVELVRSVVSG